MSKELLQQALDALNHIYASTSPYTANGDCTFSDKTVEMSNAAIAALEAYIAQPEQKPVYQYQLANGNWINQAKESYDYNVKLGQAVVRVLYSVQLLQPNKGLFVDMITNHGAEFAAEITAAIAQPALQIAAQAVLDRWENPRWQWAEQSPTAGLMSDLRQAIAAPVAQAEPLSDEQLERIAIEDEFLLFCDVDEFIQIARAVEQAHGIKPPIGAQE